MDKQEGLSTNRDLIFDDSNYTFWKIRMEFYLQSLGMDVWKSMEVEYEFLKMQMSQKITVRFQPPKQ